MKYAALTLIVVFAAVSICSAQSTTAYFPQVVVGIAGSVVWDTAFVITNPASAGSPAATFTITMFRDDGTPFNVAEQFINAVTNQPGGTGNTITAQISGGQTRFFLTESKTPLASGFARITSNLPVVSTSVFNERVAATDKDIALAGVPASQALARQSAIVVINQFTDVGIAYANPNSTTATIAFQLVNTTGTNVGSPVTRTLAANNHTALFIKELFPQAPQNFYGTMQITTDAATPVTATTLIFTTDGAFATFPMVPLQ